MCWIIFLWSGHCVHVTVFILWIQGPPVVGPPFPYYSHTTPIRIPKDMEIVWEAYHRGVPLLGVPGITLGIAGCFLDTSFSIRNGPPGHDTHDTPEVI